MAISDKKISIFVGQNDVPVLPTANKAGNGSHLVAQFNSLIDELAATLTALQLSITAIDTKNISQDAFAAAIKTINDAQVTSINTLNTSLASAVSTNTSQNTLLTTHTSQIAALQAASTGVGAIPPISFSYLFSRSTLDTSAEGYIIFDSDSLGSASKIYLSELDINDNDISGILSKISANSMIQMSNSTGANAAGFRVQTVTRANGVITMGVTNHFLKNSSGIANSVVQISFLF